MPLSPIDRPRPIRLLVSVREAQEAETACAAGADLVDAKDPARGALGALPDAIVRTIAAHVGGRAVTSAVAGEPETGDAVVEAVAAMVATGVDYVKVALRPETAADALARAAAMAPGRLIGVFFAEDGVPRGAVIRLASAGFCGAMIDTRGKAGLRLTNHLPPRVLGAFVDACRAHGLVSGLAGSLRVTDIPVLVGYGPDYLGLRGGLCVGGDRRNALEAARVADAVGVARGCRCRDAA